MHIVYAVTLPLILEIIGSIAVAVWLFYFIPIVIVAIKYIRMGLKNGK